MFRPNSIRGLLQKSTENKLGSLSSQQQTQFDSSQYSSMDPQVEYVVDIKCAIKDVDNTINNIRQWRQQQKKNLQRNLKLNQQVYCTKQLEQQLTSQQKKQQMVNNDVLKFKNKMEIQLKNLQQILNEPQKQSQYLNRHESLLINQIVAQKIEQCERRKNKIKQQNKLGQNFKTNDVNEAFLQSLQSMNNVFVKNRNDKEIEKSLEYEPLPQIHSILDKNVIKNEQQRKTVDKTQMKADMDEIDRQLKELQQLLN